MKSIDEMVRDNVKALAPYSSARDEFWGVDYILLDANENPFDSDINRYPDPYQRNLKIEIAKIKEVNPEQVFIGNGSDEIIDLLFRCFCEPKEDTVLALSPSYGMYKVSAGINAINIHYCELNSDFSINRAEILQSIKSTDKLLFLCSPNNPTGNTFDTEILKEICEKFQGIVVVDEAYIDFASGQSMSSHIDEYENLVVLQTMSKSWGAAGLRLGIGFMNTAIVEYLNKIKPPYNVNALSQKRAIELISDLHSYQQKVNLIVDQRAWLSGALQGCGEVVKVHPSEANFILVQFKNPKKVYDLLKSESIIVRDRTKTPLCADCLRLTVGKAAQNEQMVRLIKTLES